MERFIYDRLMMTEALPVPEVGEDEYLEIDKYRDIFESFSRITYKTLYIMDMNRLSFVFMSCRDSFSCGFTKEEIMEMGTDFIMKYTHPDDLERITVYFKAMNMFHMKLDMEDRTKYTCSFNFRLIHSKTGKAFLINNQCTPLKVDAEGRIWLLSCIVSPASDSHMSDMVISMTEKNVMYMFNSNTMKWKKETTEKLNETEKNVILLSSQGLSISEIAEELHKSENTVKAYRKSIFNKLNTRNITETISYAFQHRLV